MRDPLNDMSCDRASFGYDSQFLDRLPTAEELVRGALRPAFWLESCNRNVLFGMSNGYGAEALRAVDTDALHSATADIGTRLYLAGEMLRRSGKKRLAQKFSRLAGKIYDTPFALSTRADRILDLQSQMDGVNHLANLEVALNFSSSDLRPHAFLSWSQRLPDDQVETFWSAVEQHWSGFDKLPHERFEAEFSRFRDARPRSMLERIPERLEVYRGQQRGADGLSWTTSRAVAEGFAHGHRGMINDDPVVRSTTVLREEIAFLCNERNEEEVVLMRRLSPADLV
jgi:hypothetical protein